MAKFKKLRKPCRECPFVRTSLPGYLGSDTPEHFLEMTLRDADMPCHMTIDYKQPDWLEKQEPEADLCVGAMQFQNNYMKLNRDPEIAAAQAVVGNNPAVFAEPEEFLVHHKAYDDDPTEPSHLWKAAKIDHARGVSEIAYVQAIGCDSDDFDGHVYIAFNDDNNIVTVAVDTDGTALGQVDWLKKFYAGRGELRWINLPLVQFGELVRSMEALIPTTEEKTND